MTTDAEQSHTGQSPLVNARFEAQKIAFGPMLFQAARLLRDFGILKALRVARTGLTPDEIAGKVTTSRYGVLVLLEAGLAAGMVRCEGERYFLTNTGAMILSDELTRINMDFVQHCCFKAMYFLEDSIREGRPVGLQKVFGDWETIYPALPTLPEPARTSWYKWDHYYSDAAFPDALPVVFERKHRTLMDIGGNTGKFALQCARYSADVSVTIVDLPAVAAVARKNAADVGLEKRVAVQEFDLLDHSRAFPSGRDALWMSQFLVCFPEEDVVQLLRRAAAAMRPDSTLYILDTFWDRQEFDASTYSLQAISLYFTCLANGRSRMYKSTDIAAMAETAGLKVEKITGNLGICSSLMICRRR
ncbi:MAG: methyltransferase domain-containing protein [Candidatus Parcubacteria bacterium]|nr:methyltransferase domain-containing protein [Burkholderiales bacterium]